MTCDPSCAAGTAADPSTATVTVKGHFTLVTPILTWILGQNITLSSSASATIAMTPSDLGAGPSVSPSATPSATPSASPTATPSGPTPTASPTPTPPSCLAPVANASVQPTSGKKKKQVFTFTDSSTNMTVGCSPVWSWNFGDGGGASSDPSPTHTYSSAGSYTVTLVVSNSAGQDTWTVTIDVTQ